MTEPQRCDVIPSLHALLHLHTQRLQERRRPERYMNKLAFIQYHGGLKINSSLLSIVLHD